MSLAISPSSGKPYGVARMCRVWGTAPATLYRHRLPPWLEPSWRRGPAEPIGADPASVRHDHGDQYMSDAFQGELRFLGINSSPAFVQALEDNGCAERFIRTLKKNLPGCGPSTPSTSCARRHRRSDAVRGR